MGRQIAKMFSTFSLWGSLFLMSAFWSSDTSRLTCNRFNVGFMWEEYLHHINCLLRYSNVYCIPEKEAWLIIIHDKCCNIMPSTMAYIYGTDFFIRWGNHTNQNKLHNMLTCLLYWCWHHNPEFFQGSLPCHEPQWIGRQSCHLFPGNRSPPLPLCFFLSASL